MQEEIFRELELGATVITVNARLARSYAREFHARESEPARTVWRPPDILPLDAFLDRAWNQCVWRGAADGLTLLGPLQEQLVWEQVIRASPAGETLLRIPETAQNAVQTWRLLQAYRLPVDGRFEAADDWAAFAGWARDFEHRCRANQWLDPARLSDNIARRVVAGEIPRPARLYLGGFDQVTPQQSDLFAALGAPVRIEPARYQPAVMFSRLEDASAEIRAAALWARRLLEQDAGTEIGIIVPDLSSSRAKVERIFREVLDPAGSLPDSERSFHVSLGPALSETPSIHAALLMLQFAMGGLALPAAGMLLRSPFLAGFDSEWTRRGLLDARLRRKGVWDVDVSRLREDASACAGLQQVLARVAKLVKALPDEQRPSEWARDFARLLEALGWPGDRALSSREYQILEAWRELLSDIAALDLATARVTHGQALDRVREAAASTAFQVKNEGAPVQIMGLLEASGLNFDHLWIMGLQDEALPSPAAPNPFLPVSLQREHKLPHSSAERELEFAKELIGRLLASAPDVVASYPASDGDRAFTPSPLLAGPWQPPALATNLTSEWIVRMRADAAFEELVDHLAPPTDAGADQRGGASLFKDMAACPFRAFAKHRLAARPLEESMPGLSYRDRGNTVHRALQVIWTELHSHAHLMEQSPEQLRSLISRAAREAVECIPHAIGRSLEQRRLEKLLWGWLEIEKSRDPFIVHAVEADRLVTIGGLEVKTRADRVDELASGRDLILDYKTGQLKSSAWDTDRPGEPQLPLYCATSERPIAGAAFAQIRVGELAFQGLAEIGAALPAMKKMRIEVPLPFSQQIGRWHNALKRLAENFRAGGAEVDPKDHDTCEHCGLWALCRIREFPNGGR